MTDCPLLNTLWLESELFRTWAVKAFGRNPFATMARTQLHVHHIFGGKTRKDLPSNTITICAAVHGFCHAHQTEGRIACLWMKWNGMALNWSEVNEAAGFHVPGWMSIQPLNQPFKSMAVELLDDAAQSRPATAQ